MRTYQALRRRGARPGHDRALGELRFLFGMTSSGSISILTPRPVQSGQAPCGLLKQKLRGAISPKEMPSKGAGEVLREEALLLALDVDAHDAAAELERRLDRVGEAAGRGGGADLALPRSVGEAVRSRRPSSGPR